MSVKTFYLLCFLLLSVFSNAQNIKFRDYIYTENDTIPKVVYENKIENDPKSIVEINGIYTNFEILKTINPQIISNINIVRETILHQNVEYNGKISIEIKKEYKLALITIRELLKTHTYLKEDNPIVYTIDNEIIDVDPNKMYVDENYIMRIKITELHSPQGLFYIELLTRTPQNLEKVNTLYIR